MDIRLTDQLRQHMLCHDKEFFTGWEATFKRIQEMGAFRNLQLEKEYVHVAFEEPIGYGTLLETTPDDEVVYAKRLGRELYTRFVKHKEPIPIGDVMCILKRAGDRVDTYDLITMYPGGDSEKEPEDRNIATKEEMIRSLKFWQARALIYNPDNIETESEKLYCPYQNLFFLLES